MSHRCRSATAQCRTHLYHISAAPARHELSCPHKCTETKCAIDCRRTLQLERDQDCISGKKARYRSTTLVRVPRNADGTQSCGNHAPPLSTATAKSALQKMPTAQLAGDQRLEVCDGRQEPHDGAQRRCTKQSTASRDANSRAL